jgi:predicted RNA-binding Zn-ribbon protein involved in translation (DUF1610 family)
MPCHPLALPANEWDDDRIEKEVATKATSAPWALIDRNDLTPVCPHCDVALNEVYRKGTGVALGQGRTVVYFCPHCQKVLGFAQGRVF